MTSSPPRCGSPASSPCAPRTGRVSGFTKGGDDYITKPFLLERELIARVRAVLGRTQSAAPAENRLHYADLEIDENTMRVSRDGRAAWCFFAEGDAGAEAWVADKALAVLKGQASTVAASVRRKATCRRLDLVKDRMDITGARWSVTGAEAVLKLRALRANDDLPAYWQFHLSRELQRVHQSRYADNVIPTAA